MNEDELNEHKRRMLDFIISKRKEQANEEVSTMPLTSHGKKVMASMKSHYGAKKGKQVFYALANKSTQGGRGKIGGKKVH